ncbi:hypothetical protein BDY21DRAFT_341019 [Lineolata rhizophorae]|uniref:HECT-type E3 ubiquitin transferase n=1 Tax=Lineolata rhizophorae TaxID=578093 RepID=A0A6A6P3V0_9PEZI|nr:hypothetical protein BDY21DRAFT_341019 [Lineolata rhizophorae]
MPPWSSRHLLPSSQLDPSAANAPSTHRNARLAPRPDQDPRHGASSQHLNDYQAAFPTLHPPQTQQERAAAMQPSTPRNRPHARSFSHTFPALFGVGRRKSSKNIHADFVDDSSSDDEIEARDTQVSSNSPQKRAPGGSKQEDSDMTIGNCMVCDSRISWPKGKNVFRCTVCVTINDLEPLPPKGQDAMPKHLLAPPDDPSSPSNFRSSSPACLLLSVERTRAILDRCVTSYLKERSANRQDSPIEAGWHHSEDPEPVSVSDISVIRTAMTLRQPSNPRNLQRAAEHSYGTSPPHQGVGEYSTPSAQAKPSLESFSVRRKPLQSSSPTLRPAAAPPPPLRRPPPPPGPSPPVRGAKQSYFAQDHPRPQYGGQERITPITVEEVEARRRHDRVRSIFRQLEDYIIYAVGDFDCLNSSFYSGRPLLASRSRSESSIASPRQVDNPTSPGGNISELDPKTLLLGDFAENGQWWAGRVDRNRSQKAPSKPPQSPDYTKQLVNHRSPKIDWKALAEWYEEVLRAGETWQEAAHALGISGFTEAELRDIDNEIRDARVHVQRTLLKMTETVLKRPSRPLKKPYETRFLFIMLGNPLLYPSTASTFEETKTDLQRPTERQPGRLPAHNYSPRKGRSPPSRVPSKTKRGESGHHQGIIKRILGLIANLPNECHHNIITWLSRLTEDHLRRLVDLVGGFVTYRLSRQNSRNRSSNHEPIAGLVPEIPGPSGGSSAQLHAALGLRPNSSTAGNRGLQSAAYTDDWQLKAAAKVMQLLFAANNIYYTRKPEPVNIPPSIAGLPSAGLAARQRARNHGQLLPTSDFYNTLLDYSDLIADFEAWESRRAKFTFCQYPFLLSIGAKIRILEYDAKRQMQGLARDAFFDQVLSNKKTEQFLHLYVRRDCMVDDSLQRISEVVGSGSEDIKKGLRVHFLGEEGVDAGGLRKEWFLLLVRDIFDPNHGMFVYDDESHFCYFNPNTFESSDQYFLVGALLGLAIYNSTILDVALPPFAFKKLLASAPAQNAAAVGMRAPFTCTLEDLAEFRPSLARGLRQLLEFEGDVEQTFCRDFVVEVDRYGTIVEIPLCPNGRNRPVTNDNRQDFVDLYVRFLLDTVVSRQFEPFKRGFFTVCGGNALSLIRPEEIELLVRGSDEPLDVASIRAVAVYENWRDERTEKPVKKPDGEVPVVGWFWELFEAAGPKDQRKMLSFITGSDRIPAVGATNLVIKIACLGEDTERYPVARTCFNVIQLYKYASKEKLARKLWQAVLDSEGFGLK